MSKDDDDRAKEMIRQARIGNQLHKIQLEFMIETLQNQGKLDNSRLALYKRMVQKVEP